MAQITLKNIVKEYGDGFKAVNDINLDIADGEFMIFVGPSGCGKSTTLRMVVGLEDITSGDLLIDGKTVNDLAPKDRNLAMVFQNYALYPHLTVRENIAFPLRLNRNKLPEQEIRRRVDQAAEMLELTEHLERKPANLSGGQRQRVWIAMALAQETDVLLLDEPTTYLDVANQLEVLDLLIDLNARRGTTVVMVLHDLGLAARYSDELIAMRSGSILAQGTPSDVVTEETVREVFGISSKVVPDPVSGAPLVMPIGRHRVKGE